MQDGGTLGEVLEALLSLECLQILEELKPAVKAYLAQREKEEEGDEDKLKDENAMLDPKFFSVLATLCQLLGKQDPCYDLQKFATGLKCQAANRGDEKPTAALTHTGLVRGGPTNDIITRDPLPNMVKSLKMDLDHDPIDLIKKDSDVKQNQPVCRILLMFADDGVEAANFVCRLIQGYKYAGFEADLFRLDEHTLWYEVLANPEACCAKWIQEADYVMPIITPNLLTEIHSKAGEESANGSLLPLSPVLNRFMYNQLRARFSAAGCKNTMVRPVIPQEMITCVREIVEKDLLLRVVWVTTVEDQLIKKIRSMLANMAR